MDCLKEKIERFLSYGYGDGNGYGNGNGNGYGDGNGYGNGNGDGYGNGNGDGDGYGYGYGDGNGYGYGNSYGYGNGNGIKSFNGKDVYIIDHTPTLIESIHTVGNVDYAKCYTIKNNTILVPCFVVKVDGFFAHGETLKQARADAVAKAERNMPLEQRMLRVKEQHPDADKPISHKELFALHNRLTGSCEFGRKQFCEQHGLDPSNGEMTMREFIKLTANAYGGNAIRELAKSYNIVVGE